MAEYPDFDAIKRMMKEGKSVSGGAISKDEFDKEMSGSNGDSVMVSEMPAVTIEADTMGEEPKGISLEVSKMGVLGEDGSDSSSAMREAMLRILKSLEGGSDEKMM